MQSNRLALIVAYTKNGRVIGIGNSLPWPSYPEDMKHFKALTTGHHVIMGRKTWDSIPAKYRPLPNRTNHVISNNIGFIPEGATMHMAVINAVKAAWDAGDTLPFIIGGAQIYKLAMPYVTEMWITEIQNDHAGDVVFPAFNEGDWETTGEELSKDGALKFIVKYRKGCGIGNVK